MIFGAGYYNIKTSDGVLISMKNIYFGILVISFLYACSTTPKPVIPKPLTPPTPKPVTPKPDSVLDNTVALPVEEEENFGCLESPDNCMNRWGLYVYDNGSCYEGYFKNGKKDGSGILYHPDNMRIETFWHKDKNVGEENRTFGKTMEEKYDPISLKKTCEKHFLDGIYYVIEDSYGKLITSKSFKPSITIPTLPKDDNIQNIDVEYKFGELITPKPSEPYITPKDNNQPSVNDELSDRWAND